MARNLETRSFPLELRSDGDGDGKLCGNAIVFDSMSVDFGGWMENIHPDSLDDIELDDDLYLDYDHDSRYILGRAANDTLKTELTDKGVSFEAVPPETSFAADIREMIRGGYVRGCSFAFECLDDTVERVEGTLVRTIKRMHVYALTITGIPAYPETCSEVRSRILAAGDAAGNIAEDEETEAHGAEVEERGSEAPRWIGTAIGAVRLIEKKE